VVIKIRFKFGTRKIQNVRYTYLVPLPVAWVKTHGLGQSDSVEIELLEDSSLKVTPVSSTARQDCEENRELNTI
jgi:antitoxin MazE